MLVDVLYGALVVGCLWFSHKRGYKQGHEKGSEVSAEAAYNRGYMQAVRELSDRVFAQVEKKYGG